MKTVTYVENGALITEDIEITDESDNNENNSNQLNGENNNENNQIIKKQPTKQDTQAPTVTSNKKKKKEHRV